MSNPSDAPRPLHRSLRGYAFDPSLSLTIDTSDFNEITYKTPWEDELCPGPKGEYLEVIDFDPTVKKGDFKKEKENDFGVYYKSVDLNDPHILASDGLAPSDSNPQFHQQMVYAVAMKTIRNFEKALGRKIIWREKEFIRGTDYTDAEINDTYVQRLRVYPHALREPNAYYSPAKRAILFGYFKSTPSEKQIHMPNSWVFTCLSHDIIAHEVTHAILDGLNMYYNEPTNPDVLAFHEAFADIVALFQHFTMPEVLKSQISRTKGNLENQNLLGQLAQEFGSAIGGYGSLRDAIGEKDENGEWKRTDPDPSEYDTILEPHKRGSILVAAVFDAFLTIYKSRVADLVRIATGGTGILPDGDLHPDLVNRMANEASKAAGHILNMCIRALDYCPPVDITFGEYLRALITADCDIVDDDDHNYRLAFIEAFKRRGIYPEGIKTLSVESLKYPEFSKEEISEEIIRTMTNHLKAYSRKMKFEFGRKKIFKETKRFIAGQKRNGLHRKIFDLIQSNPIGETEKFTGTMANESFKKCGIWKANYDSDSKGEKPNFWITNLREISRVGPSGKKLNHIKLSIVQTAVIDYGSSENEEKKMVFRGGTNFIFDLDTASLKYKISKPIFDRSDHSVLDKKRLAKQYNYQFDPEMNGMTELEKYFGLKRYTQLQEPFALLHNH